MYDHHLGEMIAPVRRDPLFAQILLADTVGELNQPTNRLTLGGREMGAVRETFGRLPELGPAAIKIDEVAHLKLPTFPGCWLPGLSVLIAHTERLMQTGFAAV